MKRNSVMPEDNDKKFSIFKKVRSLFSKDKQDHVDSTVPYEDVDKKIMDVMQKIMEQTAGMNMMGMFGMEWLTEISKERRKRYQDYDEVYLRVPELSAACIIYAANCLQKNFDGEFFRVETSMSSLDTLIKGFLKRLKLNENLWILVHDLMKYGDLFVELIKNKSGSVVQLKVHRPETIINLVDETDHTYGFLKVNEDKFDEFMGSIMKTNSSIRTERDFIRQMNLMLMAKTAPKEASELMQKYKKHISIFNTDQMVHFKLSPSSMYHPYGISVLEYPRGIIKQILFMELSLIIYRVTRAPEHRIFNVEVGDVAPSKVRDYMTKFKESVKRQKVLNNMDSITSVPNLLTQQDDYYIPNSFGSPLYSIETTAAGELTSKIDDINWLYGRLFAALRIPRSYISFDEEPPGFAALTSVDQRFARIIENYQRDIASGLKKIVNVQLKALGKEHLSQYYDIKLYAAQQSLENEQLDGEQRRIDIAQSYLDLGHPKRWVWRHVFKYTDSEILELERMTEKEKATSQGITDEEPKFL